MSGDFIEKYRRDGFSIIRGAIPAEKLDSLENSVLGLIESWTGKSFQSISSPEFAAFLANEREIERKLYNDIRAFDWVEGLSLQPEITSKIRKILGEDIVLMKKIPFRIDLPNVTRELAVWHQDFFYVKGNTDVVTAWIPLQDTSFREGCLMVMPGSHELGALPHDVEVLGKRHYPSGIFDREIRYAEMKRGDLLLFNALLLHSSGVNISNVGRFSIQARYSRANDAVDPVMGGTVTPEVTA